MGAHGTITEDKKNEIRELLKKYGIQESARTAQVSYYTAWCVFHNKYEQKHLKMDNQDLYSSNKCPITGWDNL